MVSVHEEGGGGGGGEGEEDLAGYYKREAASTCINFGSHRVCSSPE